MSQQRPKEADPAGLALGEAGYACQVQAESDRRTAEIQKRLESGRAKKAEKAEQESVAVAVAIAPDLPEADPTANLDAVPAADDAPAQEREQVETGWPAHAEPFFGKVGRYLLDRHASEKDNFHAAGKETNGYIGPPTDRQKYGQRVVEELSRRFETSVSTLHAARWFAHKYPDLEAFRRQHPEATTFSRVKALLSEKKSGGQPGRQSDRRLADKLFRDLEEVCNKLPALSEGLTKREMRALHALVQRLNMAVATHLFIPAPSEDDDSAEVAPPD
jgi:hypothetical protein